MSQRNLSKSWQIAVRLVLVILLAISPVCSYAQGVFVATLPEPGTMVAQSPAFVPVLVKGLVVHPEKPLFEQNQQATGPYNN